MTLAQIYALADSGSYYSHTNNSDEIYNAINQAGLSIYLWITKEMRNYFIKWDTTTIAFAPGQAEYVCPPDLAEIIRFGERMPGETNYRRMTPTDPRTDLFAQKQFEPLVLSWELLVSDFCYVGPYLPQTAAKLPDAQKIYNVRIAGTPQDVRQTEIIYTAKWLDINSPNSFNVIPPEGQQCQLNKTKAELLRGNGDDLADKYEAVAAQQLTEFLTYVRDRQIQQTARQVPYLEDLD